MFRGTTPTLNFVLPFAADTVADGFISIAQNRRVVVDKPISDWVIEDNTIKVTLTQEETLSLGASNTTEIQIRVKLADGTALASKIFTVSTERILRDGVI